MKIEDIGYPEYPRYVNGSGFLIGSADATDEKGWREDTGYFLSYDFTTTLWSLLITRTTEGISEDGSVTEDTTEEKIEDLDFNKLSDTLNVYELEIDRELANRLIKRLKNPHIL